MFTIPLERCDNFLVLPEALPDQDYVVTATLSPSYWHILPAILHSKMLELLIDTSDPDDRERMAIMMRGTCTELQRQGNLLLIPEKLITVGDSSNRYVLKLEKEYDAD
ncbi:hypothetical protein JAO78_007395 [Alishewanella sp. 16-MA]|uniref:Uncharacterized protein n=1 Tax=Alishewanella maricola TaxID=2795740 RepID=A0ABS8C3S2_9ALTE|nr:hypothetical protein [Alishewanella maricola]MCB5226640.1 hypothetical protein [Alishewanella maricola]